MKRNKAMKWTLSFAIALCICMTYSSSVFAAPLRDGVSVKDSIMEITKLGKPATPTGLRITGYRREGNAIVGMEFAWNGKVPTGGTCYLELSETSNFASVTTYSYGPVADLYRSYEYLKPGTTYYARVQIYDFSQPAGDRWSDYSNVTSFKTSVPEMSNITATVKSNNIRLYMSANVSAINGFQIWRMAAGGKYQRLANTSERTYLDTGLSANTKYTYKIRPYYYDEKTKKIIYGGYSFKEYATSGSALNLDYDIVNGKYVKLTWNSIKGVKGYKIYRSNASSEYDTIKNGKYNSYRNYELIKTINKGSTKSFTDKKAKANTSYSYKVEVITAYANSEGNIYNTVSVSTKFESIDILMEQQNANGTKYVKWRKISGADGYVIEKRNVDGQYTLYKKLGKNVSSITFPKPKLGEEDIYRIKVYKGNSYSSSRTVYVDSCLPIVQSVSASPTATGVKISWSAVPGASYYRVCRTTMNYLNDYNADGGYYDNTGYTNGSTVYQYTNITKGQDGYYTLWGSDYKIKTTSVNDNYYQTSETSYVGPTLGQTYMYYVIAYAESPQGYTLATSLGCKKIGKATYTGVKLTKKPTLSKPTSNKKGEVSIKIKKKVAGASGYIIYRSVKKKGGYEIVGTTSKLTFTDKKLASNKTYYYKVRAYRGNEIGADVYSPYCKEASVKVK